MSLGVAIKGPEGVVLAADSRVTLEAKPPGAVPIIVNFDNATKLLSFSAPNNFVGAVTYGAAVIGLRTAHSFVPEFELSLSANERLSVKGFAEKLSEFYMGQWGKVMPKDYNGPPMTFTVGGYNQGDAYGQIYVFDVPQNPQPDERNPGTFGMAWGGQHQIVGRLIQGFDPVLVKILKSHFNLNEQQYQKLTQLLKQNIEFRIPYEVLPLQDCVDLAIFLIRTTISAQHLSVGIRGVGGTIEVATITRIDGLKHVQRKTIHGEFSGEGERS